MSNLIAKTLRSLGTAKPLPSLADSANTLPQILSRVPGDVAGRRVHQTRWTSKNINDTYWEITRARLKLEGKHGKVWGKLYWRGKLVNETPTLIRGGLKFKWSDGVSLPTPKNVLRKLPKLSTV